MQLNSLKLAAIVETAKSRTTDRRWIAAIDKAVAGLTGAWIVTELKDCVLITTESGETYRANGHCTCKAFQFNHHICKHRAAAQLLKRYNETASLTEKMAERETAPMVKPDGKSMKIGAYDV